MRKICIEYYKNIFTIFLGIHWQFRHAKIGWGLYNYIYLNIRTQFRQYKNVLESFLFFTLRVLPCRLRNISDSAALQLHCHFPSGAWFFTQISSVDSKLIFPPHFSLSQFKCGSWCELSKMHGTFRFKALRDSHFLSGTTPKIINISLYKRLIY